MAPTTAGLDLSVIAPARDEGENLAHLVREITEALDGSGLDYEIIIVDDASTDGTPDLLRHLLPAFPRLRALRLDAPAAWPHRPNGQSAAFKAGIDAARGRLIATLDADGQSDPADLPRLLALWRRSGADMVQGDRAQARCDSAVRRIGSAVGRITRRLLLGDAVRDTGCSLRIMARDLALALPLQYRGIHRFIPHAARQLGAAIIEAPVNHRPRRGGRTKYSNLGRAWPGFIDCLAMRWMRSRRVDASTVELTGAPPDDADPPLVETAAAGPRRAVER